MIKPSSWHSLQNFCFRSLPLLLASVLLTNHSGCGDTRPGDRVTVKSEGISPNGAFIATSFDCDGGGAAGYAYTNVCLHRSDHEMDPRDGLLGKHKTWSGFSNIKIRWIDDRNLEISYQQIEGPQYEEQNGTRVTSKEGVTIHYVVIP